MQAINRTITPMYIVKAPGSTKSRNSSRKHSAPNNFSRADGQICEHCCHLLTTTGSVWTDYVAEGARLTLTAIIVILQPVAVFYSAVLLLVAGFFPHLFRQKTQEQLAMEQDEIEYRKGRALKAFEAEVYSSAELHQQVDDWNRVVNRERRTEQDAEFDRLKLREIAVKQSIALKHEYELDARKRELYDTREYHMRQQTCAKAEWSRAAQRGDFESERKARQEHDYHQAKALNAEKLYGAL